MAKLTILENKKLMMIFGVVLLVLFLVGGISISGSFISVPKPPQSGTEVIEAVDPQTGKKYTFRADGFVTYIDENGNTISEVWEQAKITAFLDYLKVNFVVGGEGGYQISIGGASGSSGSGGDELITTATGGGGGGSGGGTGQYFATPTPTPYNLPIQGSNPTPGPTLPPPAPSWCLFWRLSYCADAPLATVTPSPSYPPGVIEAANCDEWSQKSQYKTVISQGSCSQ